MLNNPCKKRVPKNRKHFLTEEAEKGNWQVGCPQGLFQAHVTTDQNMARAREVRRTQRPVRLSLDSEQSLKYDDDSDDDKDNEAD